MTGDVIEVIFEVFESNGATAYVGEPVTLREHMLQSAHAAEQDGAPADLVAAALLHDIGHLLHDEPEDVAELVALLVSLMLDCEAGDASSKCE